MYVLDRLTGCIGRVSGSPLDESWTPSVAAAINGAGTLIVFSSTQRVDSGDVRFLREHADTAPRVEVSGRVVRVDVTISR